MSVWSHSTQTHVSVWGQSTEKHVRMKSFHPNQALPLHTFCPVSTPFACALLVAFTSLPCRRVIENNHSTDVECTKHHSQAESARSYYSLDYSTTIRVVRLHAHPPERYVVLRSAFESLLLVNPLALNVIHVGRLQVAHSLAHRVAGSLRTSTRQRSEHDLHSGWMLIQKRGLGSLFQRQSSACSQESPCHVSGLHGDAAKRLRDAPEP